MTASGDLPVSIDTNKEEEPEIVGLDGENIVLHCILHDDQDQLSKVFNDSQHRFYEQAHNHLNTRNSFGKSPIELACMLGRSEMLRLLLKLGADITQTSASGYSPQHFSACWGHRDCLEILVEHGLQLDCLNKAGELPKDLAMRYNHQDCVEFVDSTELDQEENRKKSAGDKKKNQHSKKKKT